MQKITDWQTNPRGEIGIASDHGGFELKKQIAAFLAETGFTPVDFGPFELDPADDYPDFGAPMSAAVSKGELPCGILLCRSGVGMGITANRFHGVRAVVAGFALWPLRAGRPCLALRPGFPLRARLALHALDALRAAQIGGARAARARHGEHRAVP